MGKTPANKRLVIVALPPCDKWPELAELAEKGHTVLSWRDVNSDPLYTLEAADIILGPTCWRMADPLRKYLPNAVKAAQKAKGTK